MEYKALKPEPISLVETVKALRNQRHPWMVEGESQYKFANVLKSATLLSATPERHSQNQERRRSATPFYQKERCGSGTLIFEESKNMSAPPFPLFFF